MSVVTFLFENQPKSLKRQLFMARCFLPFTFIALAVDSVGFLQNYFDGRWLINILGILYFLIFFYFADTQLRKLMFVMVFFSYLGEIIFCKILGMYEYRSEPIPLYVPFGHAIVYGSGYIFAHTPWAIRNRKVLDDFFAVSFTLLFLGVGLLLDDVFSLIFGICFFLLLQRKRWQNLYFFIALCVIYIELVGTFFQCWTWSSRIFNVIPTVNPPMGAIFFYGAGDVLLAKIVDIWNRNLKKPDGIYSAKIN